MGCSGVRAAAVQVEFADVGGTLFFGAGLWKSDGTDSGTVRVTSEEFEQIVFPNPSTFTAVGDTLFFTTFYDGSLWTSDGTAAGTVPLRPELLYGADSLTAVDGTLFFTANNPTANNPRGLWKSDGTEAGTVLVKDVWQRRSGYYSPEYGPESLTSVNGTLFFTANDGTTGRELWKSDGTTDGTVLVKDINPGLGGSNPTALTNVDGRLVFQACEQQSGCEVWASDGTTAGTRLLADIEPGAASSSPSGFTRSGSLLYFSAQDLLEGRELRAVPLSALPFSTCVGDCDGKGSVTVDELLTMVNIALGNAQGPACPHGVPSGAAVNVALIIQAVNTALNGCGA